MIETRCDVAVVGGGPAGIAAALAAAGAGAETLLIERDPRPGGNASQALVHTICGLYRPDAEGAQPAHPGLPLRFVEALERVSGVGMPETAGRVHYLPMRPPLFAAIAERACAAAKHLDVWLDTALVGAELATGVREEHRLRLRGPDGERSLRARVVVDTSGEAAAAHLGGAETEMAPVEQLQRPSFIFRLEGVETAASIGFERLRLTASVGRAARSGELPAECESVVVRADGQPGSLYATLTLPPLAGRPYEPLDPAYLAELYAAARGHAERVLAFLRAERPGFAAARVADWPTRVGIRETRRVRGRVELGRDDILEGRPHPDQVALSTWPIELWEDHRRPSYEYPAAAASIPLGALVSRSHPTLGMAGRCLSASHEALGALRVIGTALATGEAIGVAAALAVDAGVPLASVAAKQVRRRIVAQAHDYPLP